MHIDIHARGFRLTEGLREYIKRRLRFALDCALYSVSRVIVRLSDINGPRGGSDKRCLIRVPVSGGKCVVIADVESDLYVAIDRAADRARQVVIRRLGRLRECRRVRVRSTGCPSRTRMRYSLGRSRVSFRALNLPHYLQA